MTGEASYIDLLRAIASDPAARGLRDDTAVLPIGGETLILTHDMMVLGTHILPDANPADVAWKLVATNLSDLAAKGAEPLGVLTGHMLGDAAWDARFAEGLRAVLSQYNVALWGGDTVAAPADSAAPRSFGLTAIGRATHTPVPSRSGARAGDDVWLAGAIGDAMLGWMAESGQLPDLPSDTASQIGTVRVAYLRPTPLIVEGRALVRDATAMMDVSDGLLIDAQRMALASDVTIAIDHGTIPQSPVLRAAAAQAPDLAEQALRWGDDYALLATLPPGVAPQCDAVRIGTVLPRGDTPLLIDGVAPDDSRPLGWEHAS